MLRKYRGLIINGAIFKVETEVGYQLVPADNLSKVASRDRFAVHRAQDEKTMDRTFHVANGYRFSPRHTGVEQRRANECSEDHPPGVETSLGILMRQCCLKVLDRLYVTVF